MISLSPNSLPDVACPHRFNALHIEQYVQGSTIEDSLLRALKRHTRGYRERCFKAGIVGDATHFDGIEDAESQPYLRRFVGSDFGGIDLAATWVQIARPMAFGGDLGLKPDYHDPLTAFRLTLDFAWLSSGEHTTLNVVLDRFGPVTDRTATIYGYLALQAHLKERGSERPSPKHVHVHNCELRDGAYQTWQFRPLDLAMMRQPLIDAIERVNSWEEFPPRVCDLCGECTIACELKGQLVRPAEPEAVKELAVKDAEPAPGADVSVWSPGENTEKIIKAALLYAKKKVGEEGAKVAAFMDLIEITEQGVRLFCEGCQIADKIPTLLRMGDMPEKGKVPVNPTSPQVGETEQNLGFLWCEREGKRKHSRLCEKLRCSCPELKKLTGSGPKI